MTQSLEERTNRPDATAEQTVVEVGEAVALSVPASASDEEAAAIATALGAYLTDRQRAGQREETRAPRADPWTLHGRMRALGKRRYPRDVERGEEWKAAARSCSR